jgi:hypothetical protein
MNQRLKEIAIYAALLVLVFPAVCAYLMVCLLAGAVHTLAAAWREETDEELREAGK